MLKPNRALQIQFCSICHKNTSKSHLTHGSCTIWECVVWHECLRPAVSYLQRPWDVRRTGRTGLVHGNRSRFFAKNASEAIKNWSFLIQNYSQHKSNFWLAGCVTIKHTQNNIAKQWWTRTVLDCNLPLTMYTNLI